MAITSNCAEIIITNPQGSISFNKLITTTELSPAKTIYSEDRVYLIQNSENVPQTFWWNLEKAIADGYADLEELYDYFVAEIANQCGGGGDEHENINIIHTFTLSDIGASDSEDEEILNNLITDYIESLNITVLENEIHYFQLTDYNPTSSGSPFTGLTTQNSNSINFSGLGTPASPLVANVIQGQILISSSITLNGTHNNKILIVTSDNVTITVNNTLPDDFECSIFTLANNTMFIGSSISFFGNSGLMELEINRSATIVKINNTNDIILRGELS